MVVGAGLLCCPFCGEMKECLHSPVLCCEKHPSVLLSFPWQSECDYDALYADPEAYHTDEALCIGSLPYHQRYAEHRRVALSRLQFLDVVRPRTPNTRLIDIGAGNGAFVDVACEEGYKAIGLDPAPMGDRVVRGSWRDVDGLWNILTMHDVFEHLTRPRECLRHLRTCMDDKSLLVIQTPEWEGPHQRYHGMNWKHIKPRQHLCLYSRGAIEQMYDEEGFEVVCFSRPLRGTIGQMVHYLQKQNPPSRFYQKGAKDGE